jgi:uncharacterized membrane protein YfcA
MPADMTPATVAALFAAGVVGGIVSVLVSLVSLVTYPVLLAVGLPPVAANVTNTVSLTFTGIGAGLGSRRELGGQRPTLVRLAVVAAAGGLTGAALLLVLPERVFEVVAPVLIAGASVIVMLQPRLQARTLFRPRGLHPGTVAAFYLTAVYTGYFGAAGGVLGIVVLGAMFARPLTHLIAAKNVLAGVSNGAAAIAFALFGPVAWAYVIPLAAGLFVGGLIGPGIARRLPATALRLLIGVCGLSVAAVLAWRTYL